METLGRFNKTHTELVTLEKNLLKDLYKLLKIDFKKTFPNAIDHKVLNTIRQFYSKDYDFSGYDSYLTEITNEIKEWEEKAEELDLLVKKVEETKRTHEEISQQIMNEGYHLKVEKEAIESEVGSLSREYEMSQKIFTELQSQIEEDDNEIRRRQAELNSVKMEKESLLHKNQAHKNMQKKQEASNEQQMALMRKKIRELYDEAEFIERDFQQQISEKDEQKEELIRKIQLYEREISLYKDLEEFQD